MSYHARIDDPDYQPSENRERSLEEPDLSERYDTDNEEYADFDDDDIDDGDYYEEFDPDVDGVI